MTANSDVAVGKLPTAPWKALDAQGKRWRRALEGEELYSAFQEVHADGFMVINSSFSYYHPDISFDEFVNRIKLKWIQMRQDIPMLGCRFPTDKKTGDYLTIEYKVPDNDAEARRWSEQTVWSLPEGTYDPSNVTINLPKRPDGQVAMLRVFENGGHLIGSTDEEGKVQQRQERHHLVFLTLTHAMGDLFTLCDVGRLVFEGVSYPTPMSRSFRWGDELPSLPTSLNSAYNHFLGKPSAQEKSDSARYWGRGFLPMMKKQYCVLPLKRIQTASERKSVAFKAEWSQSFRGLQDFETREVIAMSKRLKISVTALVYGAMAYEVERIGKRNGSNHLIGIVRNNRKHFPVPLRHEYPASPAPASTTSLVELPLSTVYESDASCNVRDVTQRRILALAKSFSAAAKPHIDGKPSDIGLANVDALILPYLAMVQGKTGTLLSWLPSLWSARTAAGIAHASLTRTEQDSIKAPPMNFSAFGDISDLLPFEAAPPPSMAKDENFEASNARLRNFQMFGKPGKDTLGILVYTFRARLHIRILFNGIFYDGAMIDEFVSGSLNHLRNLGPQANL